MEGSREEGELSESDASNQCEDQDVDVYNPVSRPISNTCVARNTCSSIPTSDEETTSSDSDSDFMSLPKRRKTIHSQMEIERNGSQSHSLKNGAHKKNNIWANVLQEEELLEIGGVGLKKLNSDRNVESYDYTQAQKLYNSQKEAPFEEHDEEEEETEEEIQKRLMRKRRFYDNFGESKKKEKKQLKPRHLADIEVVEEWDTEQLGCAIANALFEQKPELIVRVVEVLGQTKALALYSKTQKLEKEGGMMILNGSRRRTSGGVYLQLLKSLEGVEKSHLSQIFISDDNKESQQWRKRKRMNRNRNKLKSKSEDGKSTEDDGLHLKGIFSDEAGGTKCPGSTPVTSPTASDNEDDETALDSRMKEDQCVFLPLKEVCEKAATEIGIRDKVSAEGVLLDSGVRQEEMEMC